MPELQHRAGQRLRSLALLIRGLIFVGRRHRCPCCGWHLRAFTGRWVFFSRTRDGYCPRCNAKARHRGLWLYLDRHTDLFSKAQTLLEVAPWRSLSQRFLRMPHIRFVGLDLVRAGPHVNLIGDLRSSPLASGSVDTLLCVHVLEHVENDRQAMAELFRMLKPGGCALVSVPLRLDQATIEDATITDPEQRQRLFGERGHLRYYGVDIIDRLETAGLQVHLHLASDICQQERRQFGLRADEHIFHCHKPLAPKLKS